MIFLILILLFLAPVFITILALIFFLRRHRFFPSLLSALGIGLLATLIIYGSTGFAYYRDLTGLFDEFEQKEVILVVQDHGSLVSSFSFASGSEETRNKGDRAVLTDAKRPTAIRTALLKQKAYNQLQAKNILLIIDLTLYETLPEEISVGELEMEKEQLISMLRGVKLADTYREPSESDGDDSGDDSEKKDDESQELAFVILTSELLKQDGSAALVDGFSDAKIALLTEHHLSIDTLQSLPKALLGVTDDFLADTLVLQMLRN